MDKLKVLVVDDQISFLEYQKMILGEIGLDVRTTTDTSHIADMVKEFDPDLLMLDKMMDIDGLIIAEEIRKEFTYLPVLIVSSTDYDSDRKKAWTLGCIEYIRKDIDSEEFLSLIKDFCLAGSFAKSMGEFTESALKGVEALEEVLTRKKDIKHRKG